MLRPEASWCGRVEWPEDRSGSRHCARHGSRQGRFKLLQRSEKHTFPVGGHASTLYTTIHIQCVTLGEGYHKQYN